MDVSSIIVEQKKILTQKSTHKYFTPNFLMNYDTWGWLNKESRTPVDGNPKLATGNKI